ncbi:ABC transporter permease [Pullulanibacillus sp. KACC 23026]|uniref:FtsX-like permease family protein n=1 Tax=Pullulanibacillus sp. KACC 23026 TaxID=3028315 RepID=UPI0023B1036E|nr:ABC transporter permease [Pullulanibacillus sp. KACC 23026]WEG14328.1 ABC transporter permease [Pullulanibacillus sp. KACC 23026]
MLLKLSFSSVKKLFKDYLILLFGLTISISIFYMFEALAQNKAFVQSNAMVGSIMFIFHVGSFILAFITLFYIFYATSFILSLRQKELGLYMTLGAKKYKVTQLMFFETFMIGLASLLIGLVVGIGLSAGVSDLLMKQLDFSAKGFHPYLSSAVWTTVIFYIALFLLTAIVNAVKLGRLPVLKLIHADQEKDRELSRGVRTLIGAIVAIALIGAGYYVIFEIKQFLQYGVLLAAVTITVGTYFLFMSLLPYFLKKVKRIRLINEKDLNSFTIGQLIFRISNLTKVLGTVSMLIALGLGAMTASLSFYNNISVQASMAYSYDLTVFQPSQSEMKLIHTLTTTEKNVYHYKVTDQGVYFLKEDLLKNRPLINSFNPNSFDQPKSKRIQAGLPKNQYSDKGTNGFSLMPQPWKTALSNELGANSQMFGKRTLYILDKASYNKLAADQHALLIAKVPQFTKHLDVFQKIDEQQKELAKTYTGIKPAELDSEYENYLVLKEFASGTIFMGVFLGVAFLLMMVSVLMFKLLSSATVDIKRYEMLRKIGVRRSLLTLSIYKELFLVFLFPALVGFAHVLVGMKMFGVILIHPYTKIWLPICIFLVIYGFYYVLTVQMYKQIVLPKEK